MSDKEVLEKVKEYLELDIENGEEEIRLYAEALFFWIKEWTKEKV